MKKIISILAMSFAGFAFADDFNHVQNNMKLKVGDVKLEFRQDTNSTKDHIQVGYTGIKNFELEYRHVDDVTVEHRSRITYTGLTNGFFYLNPRLEYRHFEGATDDYYRLRAVVGAKQKSGNITLWTEFQPSWNFGKQGEDNDSKVDSSQLKVGFDYQVNKNVEFGPFVQYDMNKDWKKSDLFLGTNLTVKF